MQTITNVINLVVNGLTLPLRQQTSKYGNAYWAVLATKADGTRYFNKRGTKVTMPMPKAGDSIEVLGNTLTLSGGKNEKGKAQARITSKVVVPGVGPKQLSVIFTDLGEGEVNVTASIRGIGEGGGAKARGVDEL